MTYLAHFTIQNPKENKIKCIKFFRTLTELGLRESKEFVENILFSYLQDWQYNLDIRLTQAQLGRFYIAKSFGRIDEEIFNLQTVEELPEPQYLDITRL